MIQKKYKAVGRDYKAYRRKGQIAVNFLYRKKKGEIRDALFNRNIGWIDLVWGEEGTANSDGWGLAKIAKYHPEVLPHLARIIKGAYGYLKK